MTRTIDGLFERLRDKWQSFIDWLWWIWIEGD
jgi:hypothetical protein